VSESEERVLLERLKSPDTERRVEAATELRGLTHYQLAVLVRRAARMQTSTLRRAAPCGLVALAFVAFVASCYVWRSAGILLICVLVCAISLFLGIILTLSASSGRGMETCLEGLSLYIESHSGVESLSSLLGLLSDVADPLPTAVRRNLQSTLRRIVPEVTHADFLALGAESRARLLSLLRNPYDDTELTLAAIEMLARQWDPNARDLRSVLTVTASQGAMTPNMRKVRAAAASALALLDARKTALMRSGSLLRPSASPEAPADDLLRAATHLAASAPGELLRSAQQAEIDRPVAPKQA
jgi:hypothetical protein